MKQFLSRCCAIGLMAIGSIMSIQAFTPVGDRPMAKRHLQSSAFDAGAMLRPSAKTGLKRANEQLADSRLFATMVYSQAWNSAEYGIYKMSVGSEEGFAPVVVDGGFNANAGAVMTGDKYFVATSTGNGFQVFSMKYKVYDATTWELVNSIDGDIGFEATDMAYDPTTGNIYGCFADSNSSDYYFGTFDLSTFSCSKIVDLEGYQTFSAISVDSKGRLFAMTDGGELYNVDKVSGALTLVGNTGLSNDYFTTGAIDPVSGKFYYAVCSASECALYDIDTGSAVATKLYDFSSPMEFAGMYVTAPEAMDDAPAAPENVTLAFGNGSLNGMVDFDVPTVTFGGSPISGTVNYTVVVNGESKATGSASCGSHVSVPVSVSANGMYAFEVSLSNAEGNSPVTRSMSWIGLDQPLPVTGVELGRADNSFVLTWNVPAGVHGGYINGDDVTYTITRYPGGSKSTVTGSTSFTEPVAEDSDNLSTYYYSVAPAYNGNVAVAAESNRYTLGYLSTPFSETFDTEASMSQFNIIDANNDGTTWTYSMASPGQLWLKYNYKMDSDDWLVLPPLKMEAGRMYSLSFDFRGRTDGYVERIEARIGTKPTPSGMSTVVIPPTETVSEEFTTLREYFSVEADGIYFIGIHGCSSLDQYSIYLDNIKVSAPLANDAPGAVTDLTLQSVGGEIPRARLAFKAPAIDMVGAPLTSLDGIRIYRNGELIGEVEPKPAIGADVEFFDNNAPKGRNTYVVTPYNNSGVGREVSIARYIGIGKPVDLTGVKVSAGTNAGEAIISWDPVTVDVNGNTLDESMVKYTVLVLQNYLETARIEGVTDTVLHHQYCDPDGEQQSVRYAVYAVTSAGNSGRSHTDQITLGKSYNMPFHESFAGGMSYKFFIDTPTGSDATWSIYGENSFEDILPQDGDIGMLGMMSSTVGDQSTFKSGKIYIGEIPNPTFSFYYFDYPTSNTFDVLGKINGEWKVLETVKLTETEDGWVKKTYDLSAVAGQDFEFGFRGTIVESTLLLFDNIVVSGETAHNLAVGAVSAPASVAPGKKFNVSTLVINNGLEPASGYEVEFYRDNNLLMTLDGSEILPGASVRFSIEESLMPVGQDEVSYYAAVKYDVDEYKADNVATPVKVLMDTPSYPVVDDLAASVGDKVTLSWSAPVVPDEEIVEVTEDFEGMRPMSIGLPSSVLPDDNLGDWSVIDGDKCAETYVLKDGDAVLSYPNVGKAMAFQAIDANEIGMRDALMPHSGNIMMMCFASVGTPNNDWLISPVLSGEAQTVSLYAKSLSGTYKETFEFLYSLGGKSSGDFVSVGKKENIGAEWTEYRFDIPEGATYFAIRCISNDRWVLCVDDVTFRRSSNSWGQMSLIGYNVYRNGIMLNESPLTETSFVDNITDSETYTYYVTVVYDKGESAVSNAAVVSGAGIADAAISTLKIYAVNGGVAVEGASGMHVSLFTADGMTVVSSIADSNNFKVNLASGFYIVKVGNVTRKVIVK